MASGGGGLWRSGSGGRSGSKNSKDRGGDKTQETVCNMLSMLTLGVDEETDNQKTLLLSMANTPESCLTLRRAGCIPLLVQLIHPPHKGEDSHPEIIRVRAARALKNIVQFNPDEKEKKKELRVLRLLEGIRLFSEAIKGLKDDKREQIIQHPTTSLGAIMKLSFDEEHRYTMCLLGAIHALADLIVSDHVIHGNDSSSLKEDCLILRRLTGMALTNLTVNDKTNKALLCGMKDFLNCLVAQLDTDNEEICQISASVLRNLSCRVDSASRTYLSETSACSKLMIAAMRAGKESTLKANLGAIWNLSAQCPKNMKDISTASEDALPFLVSLMKPNKTSQLKSSMTILEHASSILHNVSPHIRASPQLKKIVRDSHCYEILLEHLTSSSMLVVGNACGTLCSLSGGPECEEDQRKLLDLNAIPMLKSLVYSKDQRISQGSSTALRNLLSSKFAKEYTLHLDSRLSAQIYSPSKNSTAAFHPQKSPSSDSDHEAGSREPPAAHQQSTSTAASLLFKQQQQRSCKSAGASGSNLSHSQSPLDYRGRPSTISYYNDSEPLDLTMASAKSSPIHVISAAEFPGMRNIRGQRMTSAPHHHHSSYQFYSNYGTATNNARSGFSFSSGVKFNQSCPEILSRLQGGGIVLSSIENKPLDFSSTAGSASSSNRGGIECSVVECDGSNNGSGGGGIGGDRDTTFNYSLRFAEDDDGDADEETRLKPAADNNDDTIKTYCYEGTPQTFSKSNSCQDLVQEFEFETGGGGERGSKLQPIDEVKPYYVENTPAAFSRASSLSSIHSMEGCEDHPQQQQVLVEPSKDSPPLVPPVPIPRKRSHTPCRVTFSAEETPLMFSRCSSVASLDSMDHCQSGGNRREHNNEDDLSDYSRRASEVVSPSELPDSPRTIAPPRRHVFDQEKKINGSNGGVGNHAHEEEQDDLKVYEIEKSGLQSCRSLSPLTVDGEELPMLKKEGPMGAPMPSNDGTDGVHVQEEVKPSKRGFPDDELKVFAMEGTPFYGVSTATSLSDLMADIEEEPQEQATGSTNCNEPPIGNNDIAEKQDEIECKSEMKPSLPTVPTAPIYSDAQLLEKCIRVGKAMGIPKSQSEFKINAPTPKRDEAGGKSTKALQKNASKSQDFEFDDPDLAALIQIGRNRTNKNAKKSSKREKSKVNLKSPDADASVSSLSAVASFDAAVISEKTRQKSETSSVPRSNSSTLEKVESLSVSLDEKTPSLETSSRHNDIFEPSLDASVNSRPLDPDPNQISIMSIGSEWDDETKTFSSPIQSMSVSTAMKMAGSNTSFEGVSHSIEKPQKTSRNMNENSGCLSTNIELLDNIEPPSAFSNLVSSADCQKSPLLQAKLQRKWKNLAADSSTHSNLMGQRPPPDFDMENSMISVASIKSEIYEMSSTDNDEPFHSAVEEVAEEPRVVAKGGSGGNGGKDNSIGGNTYTIFPSENANRLSGVKSNDLSDGGNTVISEDFTDAEDIEEYETPSIEPLAMGSVGDVPEKAISIGKPILEVSPTPNNKYSTFLVKKSPGSPRCSPKQKRRDDPERYKTHTITPLNMRKDANGNPEMKFATFRVGGPKLSKGDVDSASPQSTPPHSPKGVRGRRKPLYSSLPPSARVKQGQQNTTPPPVPPKPGRISSPSPTTPPAVYVRATRTTELRIAARDNPPARKHHDTEGSSSRTSSNSSLHLIRSECSSVVGLGSTSSKGRPKVAPKPPHRTTPSIGPASPVPPATATNVPIQLKGSNSSFSFGGKVSDSGSGMKAYSTLPKPSKPSTEPFSLERYCSSSSSNGDTANGEIKQGTKGFGKLSKNFWKKMDFRGKEQQQPQDNKKSSKLSNLFGKKKDKRQDKATGQQQQPFRDPQPVHIHPVGVSINSFASSNLTPPIGGSVRREGENNKVITVVSPFNYTPPDRTTAVAVTNDNSNTAIARTSKITTV